MKTNYYTAQLEQYKHDTRKTWKTIRSLIDRERDKSNVIQTYKIDSGAISDPSTISNGFCKYFSRVGMEQAKQIRDKGKRYSPFLGNREPNSLFLAPTDPAEIRSMLHSVKANNSCGHDSMSPARC